MNRRRKGAAMVELIIVIGLLIFCAFGVYELTAMLDSAKTIANLSREAANAAKRDCSSGSPAFIQACVQRKADKIVQVGDQMLAGGDGDGSEFSDYGFVRIMVWNDPRPGTNFTNDMPGNPDGASANAPIIVQAGGLSPSPGTRYNNVPGDSDFREIYNGQTSIVVSEIYYAYRPHMGFLSMFLGRAPGANEVLYETVLY